MKDSQDYFVIINDLFKVYFLWGKHTYIELLRPLESKDFLILSPVEQSIQFITDDTWFYERTYKNKSNGDQCEITYEAKFKIQLRYRDELYTCLRKGLDESEKSNNLLHNTLDTFFSPYSTGLFTKYDYRGCNSKESRDKKNDNKLIEMKNKIKSRGYSKESTLYIRAIDELTNRFSVYDNSNYEHEVVRSIVENSEYHNELLHTHFSEEKLEVVSSIVSKREEIERLEAEIKADAKIVNDLYSNVLSSEIDSWDDVPLAVRNKIKEVGVRLVGVSNLMSRGGILIK